MTKTTKALITSAALAGLLAGTSAPVSASTVLFSGKASFAAQDQSQGKKDETVKEKHACAGKNSCKGKGGCATDGSVKNKAAAAKIKEKHACAGQNSCKGKGGCATDGSVKHDDKS